MYENRINDLIKVITDQERALATKIVTSNEKDMILNQDLPENQETFGNDTNSSNNTANFNRT